MPLKLPKRQQLHPSRQRSKDQEGELAHRLGGWKVKGSGNGAVKGDVRLKRVLRIEAKTTAQKSFAVTREMISKIEAAALASDELPCFVVEFIDRTGKKEMEIAILPTYILEMLGAYKQ